MTFSVSISRPTGMAAENSRPGAPMLDEWNAGTIVIDVFFTLAVPPRLKPMLSTSHRSMYIDISTMLAITAPVRRAISTASPRWSACPWVTHIRSHSTSPGETEAFGLPVRNGSTRTLSLPSIRNAACPSQVIFMIPSRYANVPKLFLNLCGTRR